MGELLSFPDRRSDSAEGGVGDHTGPSRRPWQDGGTDAEGAAAPAARGEVDAPPVDEPKWAVPGVDDGAPAAPESTRTSRRAENVAIATLTRHDASEGEVRAKLVAKGLDEADIEAELERLRRAGLIDDTAFAVRVVERLRERKGLGDSAIRSTLRGRLVPQAIVDEVLADQVEDEETAEARLQEVADDRARRLTSLTYPVAERRLTAYLMRKGFGGSAVRTATRAALDGAGIH